MRLQRRPKSNCHMDQLSKNATSENIFPNSWYSICFSYVMYFVGR